MNVDEKAASALLTQFDKSVVFHDSIPENGCYPVICYTDLTESPALHADNRLYARQHVIRVTIVTAGNAGINELKKKVESCMIAAGFMWENTNKTKDGNEYYTSLDFSIGVLEGAQNE